MKKAKAKNNWRKTIKNKICAGLFLMIGLIPIWIEGDGTLMLLMLIFAISLLFAKENYID